VLRPAGRLIGSLRVLAGHARAGDPVPVGGGGGGRIGGGRTTGPVAASCYCMRCASAVSPSGGSTVATGSCSVLVVWTGLYITAL